MAIKKNACDFVYNVTQAQLDTILANTSNRRMRNLIKGMLTGSVDDNILEYPAISNTADFDTGESNGWKLNVEIDGKVRKVFTHNKKNPDVLKLNDKFFDFVYNISGSAKEGSGESSGSMIYSPTLTVIKK